jgi:cell division protein FtsN
MMQQRGGAFLGFVIGVVVGLASALAVAIYVTKVPVPFMNKGQTRNADQNEAEAKKNKDWDPNAPLYGKPPAAAATPGGPQAAASAPAAVASAASASAPSADKKTDPKPAPSADPLGDLAKAKTAPSQPPAPGQEPYVYYEQLGAYSNAEDAESQRAKLSLSGIEAKISEREQSGRTVYRVRVGPFDKKEDGERSKEKLAQAGLETALVRVQR